MAWPLWRRVDFDEYEALCDICTTLADSQFTADGALLQALAIVLVHQAAIDARSVRAGGAR